MPRTECIEEKALPSSLVRYLAGLLLTACSLPLMAQATAPQPTHEFTLDNGLKVIVREDHRAPVAVSQIWYKVGSSYETAGLTGLSHALEHMMFKGSRKLGPGEASRILRDLGAEENAFTGADYTAYYQELASDRLAVAFELEADRLASLRLDPQEFAREIEVVKEERRLRTEDKPAGLAYERFNAMAYPASGYSIPTIGWMADLDRMTVDDLRHWYQTWYAPNNATLVVVGDVTVGQVKTLAQRYFGGIDKSPLPAVKLPLELATPGERRLTLHLKTQLPGLIMGFNVPSQATAKNPREVFALRLLAVLLDGGESARLPLHLERDQELVTAANADYDAFARGDTLFEISATPNTQAGKTLEQTETGIWRELQDLQNTPPTVQELSRIRAQLISSLVYARDSISGQATAIGTLESVGQSWQVLDRELEELQAVTPGDIQQTAKTYFTRDRLSVAHMLPEEKRNE
jgi:zinc protease